MPRSWQSRPISAIGLIVPTSLLAAMIETRTVRSVSASATASAETRPYSSQANDRDLPALARQPFDRVEDGLVLGGGRHQMVAPPQRCLRSPLMARLFDSVAPEVKMISRGFGADGRGDLLAGALDGLGRLPAEAMGDACRVAVKLSEIRQHRLDDPGIGPRRRMVVEVDRLGAARDSTFLSYGQFRVRAGASEWFE